MFCKISRTSTKQGKCMQFNQYQADAIS
ncbi:MAG: hypothetical protein RL692_1183, partial [Planctomycetota bacterium]